MSDTAFDPWHGTTILSVRKGGKVVIAGDGQVTIGQSVIKHDAKKVRKLGKAASSPASPAPPPTPSPCSSGWRPSSNTPKQLTRACVELAKDWRTDRYLRRLEAMMLVADKSTCLVLTGTGDVIEPENGVIGIGWAAPMRSPRPAP